MNRSDIPSLLMNLHKKSYCLTIHVPTESNVDQVEHSHIYSHIHQHKVDLNQNGS